MGQSIKDIVLMVLEADSCCVLYDIVLCVQNRHFGLLQFWITLDNGLTVWLNWFCIYPIQGLCIFIWLLNAFYSQLNLHLDLFI